MGITTVLSLVLSIVLSFLLSRKFAEPIAELTVSAQKLAKGDYTVQFKSSGYTEIDDLAKTLNYATAEMKATDELRKDLIANISHELRTPLTMIKAYAEMIRDLSGNHPKKREEHLQVILDETDRLAALVSDILDLSRIEAHTEEPDRTIFDIVPLVRDICARFEGMYTPEGYTLVTDLTESAFIAADYKQIGQVIYNLVGNALNYVGEDKKIYVTLRIQGQQVVFSVIDHGKGIAPEDREHIWDRYFRSAESKRTKIGSGIGLSIVKGICDAHKLEYGVNSVLGEGSEFYVKFDVVQPL
jgi:signal transduction histidine kinase